MQKWNRVYEERFRSIEEWQTINAVKLHNIEDTVNGLSKKEPLSTKQVIKGLKDKRQPFKDREPNSDTSEPSTVRLGELDRQTRRYDEEEPKELVESQPPTVEDGTALNGGRTQ